MQNSTGEMTGAPDAAGLELVGNVRGSLLRRLDRVLEHNGNHNHLGKRVRCPSPSVSWYMTARFLSRGLEARFFIGASASGKAYYRPDRHDFYSD